MQLLLTVAGLIATVAIRPGVLDNYRHHAVGFAIPVLVFGALAVMMHGMIKRAHKMAFVASGVYIVGMLVGAAFGLYPVVLPASTDAALNLTIYNTAAGAHGLRSDLPGGPWAWFSRWDTSSSSFGCSGARCAGRRGEY